MSKFTITCREFKPFRRNTLVGDAFSHAVVDALLRAFPDAFEGGEVAA